MTLEKALNVAWEARQEYADGLIRRHHYQALDRLSKQIAAYEQTMDDMTHRTEALARAVEEAVKAV